MLGAATSRLCGSGFDNLTKHSAARKRSRRALAPEHRVCAQLFVSAQLSASHSAPERRAAAGRKHTLPPLHPNWTRAWSDAWSTTASPTTYHSVCSAHEQRRRHRCYCQERTLPSSPRRRRLGLPRAPTLPRSSPRCKGRALPHSGARAARAASRARHCARHGNNSAPARTPSVGTRWGATLAHVVQVCNGSPLNFIRLDLQAVL